MSAYSKKATPHETNTTSQSGLSCRYFKWPYQANVMKTFDTQSRRIVVIALHVANGPAARLAESSWLHPITRSLRHDDGASLRHRVDRERNQPMRPMKVVGVQQRQRRTKVNRSSLPRTFEPRIALGQ